MTTLTNLKNVASMFAILLLVSLLAGAPERIILIASFGVLVPIALSWIYVVATVLATWRRKVKE